MAAVQASSVTVDTASLVADLRQDLIRLKQVGLQKSAEEIKRMFLSDWLGTWKAPTGPEFSQPVIIRIDLIEGEAEVVLTSRVAFFLDVGTKVRHAVMSDPFSPKTTPNSRFSGPGVGGKVFVSRKVTLPGMTARNIDETVASDFANERLAEIVTQSLAAIG